MVKDRPIAVENEVASWSAGSRPNARRRIGKLHYLGARRQIIEKYSLPRLVKRDPALKSNSIHGGNCPCFNWQKPQRRLSLNPFSKPLQCLYATHVTVWSISSHSRNGYWRSFGRNIGRALMIGSDCRRIASRGLIAF